jgi:hypothetical protein
MEINLENFSADLRYQISSKSVQQFRDQMRFAPRAVTYELSGWGDM